jgi:protocatechuate 3,4-dioxygenase beta subunit
MRHPEHGVLTTQLYFKGKEDHEIREKDPVWQDITKTTRDRLILPKQSPKKFDELNVAFEADAVCCKADLAFLLG